MALEDEARRINEELQKQDLADLRRKQERHEPAAWRVSTPETVEFAAFCRKLRWVPDRWHVEIDHSHTPAKPKVRTHSLGKGWLFEAGTEWHGDFATTVLGVVDREGVLLGRSNYTEIVYDRTRNRPSKRLIVGPLPAEMIAHLPDRLRSRAAEMLRRRGK